jgi:hypothetical protein
MDQGPTVNNDVEKTTTERPGSAGAGVGHRVLGTNSNTRLYTALP